jgi:hypothetical protein
MTTDITMLLNQQQLELMDNTITRLERDDVSTYEDLARLALREYHGSVFGDEGGTP